MRETSPPPPWRSARRRGSAPAAAVAGEPLPPRCARSPRASGRIAARTPGRYCPARPRISTPAGSCRPAQAAGVRPGPASAARQPARFGRSNAGCASTDRSSSSTRRCPACPSTRGRFSAPLCTCANLGGAPMPAGTSTCPACNLHGMGRQWPNIPLQSASELDLLLRRGSRQPRRKTRGRYAAGPAVSWRARLTSLEAARSACRRLSSVTKLNP